MFGWRIYPKYSGRQVRANSVDPDQTPLNAASDEGLHCFPSSSLYGTLKGSKIYLFEP